MSIGPSPNVEITCYVVSFVVSSNELAWLSKALMMTAEINFILKVFFYINNVLWKLLFN